MTESSRTGDDLKFALELLLFKHAPTGLLTSMFVNQACDLLSELTDQDRCSENWLRAFEESAAEFFRNPRTDSLEAGMLAQIQHGYKVGMLTEGDLEVIQEAVKLVHRSECLIPSYAPQFPTSVDKVLNWLAVELGGF